MPVEDDAPHWLVEFWLERIEEFVVIDIVRLPLLIEACVQRLFLDS
jgi:hypothetical protein